MIAPNQAAIGEYDELLTLVKKRKLLNVFCFSKDNPTGYSGRKKKRWEDNIKEWSGIDFASSAWAAENRIRWKGIVANSSVGPIDLPRLWDRKE